MLREIADRVWVLDFEFEAPDDSVIPRPVCLVTRELFSGEEIILAGEELRSAVCPFKCDKTEVFVAFFASAEAHCFLELGWPLPPHWIDLWAEAKRLSNGRPVVGLGLLDVMRSYGLPVRDSAHKGQMQTLVGTGAWKPDDLPAIVNYCRADVADTAALLQAMSPEIAREAPKPNSKAAWGQAILRGRFMAECAAIERRGIPFDAIGWARVESLWDEMKDALIQEVDAAYQVFSDGSFSARLFANYLANNSIPWPRRPDGGLALDEDTFRQVAKADARVATLRELRVALAQMRMTRLAPDPDGRVRTPLRPFRSKTGRSQPSATRYPFGNARWLRSFIAPHPGEVFAYLDYRSQEVAIAAYLSGDEALAATYQTGDPYMDFAIRAGLAPAGATKATHKDIRARCKVVVLAVQYGMSAESIAASSGMPLELARELLQRHKVQNRLQY